MNTKTSKLDRKYGITKLLAFSLPNIFMMLALSMYTIVDGTFISRYVGTVALSASNIVFPVINIELAIGIMIATGGSAIIAANLGEGKIELARRRFSMLVVTELIISCLFALFGIIFINQLVRLMGASETQFQYGKEYLFCLLMFAPAFLLQIIFQTMFVVEGRPTLGLIVTLSAGLTNVIMDYVLIVDLNMGIRGAAIATGLGYCAVAVIGLIYFSRKTSILHFKKFSFEKNILLNTFGNGSSEMVTNIANAVTTFLFNMVFMRFYGEDGVATITILLYLQFMFSSVYFGFSAGISPIVSFKYGKGAKDELGKLRKDSIIITLVVAVLFFIISNSIRDFVLGIFVESTSRVFEIAKEGFFLYSMSFLPMGISILASAWFTALSNGKVSAIISFARTFLFLVVLLILLPILLGKTGIWISMFAAELLGLMVSIYYLLRYKDDLLIKTETGV